MATILAALAAAVAVITAVLYKRQLTALENRIKVLEEILIVEEYRCPDCTDRATCPAADSGALFPCGKFRREDLYSC